MTEPSPKDDLELHGGFEIETPEQVSFRLERAGLGTRAVAALADSVILAALYVAIVLAAFGLLGFGGDEDARLAVVGVLIVLLTFLFWGYYLAFETIWNGQTPGKRLVGIRVVDDGGMPATFGMVLVRNLLRLVDVQFGYAVGLIAIFATRNEKRLGDLAAGTVVVNERRRIPVTATAAGRRAIDPRLVELLSDYMARSAHFDRRTRWRLARDLANRLARDLGRGPVAPHRVEAELAEMARIVFGDASTGRS